MIQEGPQSQGQWCWFAGTPRALQWHQAGGIRPLEGFFLFCRGAVTGILAPKAPNPTGGHWTPLEDGSGPAWASSPGRVAVGAHVTRQVGTAISAVWQCHLAVTAAPGRQGQSHPGPQFTSRWGTAPGTGGGHSPPAQPRLLAHHMGDKGTGHSHQPPRRAPPEPSVPNRVPLCRAAPTHFCHLGSIQNPPEIGPSQAQPLNLPRKALLSCRKRMNIPLPPH